MDTSENNEFITTAEYAALRRIKPQTARKERKRGNGPPYYRVGSRCLYRRPEVFSWMVSKRVATEAGDAS